MGKRRQRRRQNLTLTEDEYYVEKIITRKKENGRYVYFVKWEGYPESENTWIEECQFTDSTFVKEFIEKTEGKKNQKRNGSSDSNDPVNFNGTTKPEEMERKSVDNVLTDVFKRKTRKRSKPFSDHSRSGSILEEMSFYENARKRGNEIEKLTSSDIKIIYSKFCGRDSDGYLTETKEGEIVIISRDKLDINEDHLKQVNEADERHKNLKDSLIYDLLLREFIST
uniref:Chromo domain-containing protein n=1 Tax=Parastrongyloides trichosuri TaxID=131310 RepID=A0A0N4ZFK9_PARTI